MASSGPHVIIGDTDDDDFDWDAAVRAIDMACQSSGPSTSTAPADPFRTPCFAPSDALCGGFDAPFAADKRKNGASRQSTLDKFIGRAGPRLEVENRAVAVEDRGSFDSNGEVSCVEIDVEAAKTWIYPVNVPLRDYQFSITKTALFTNTLVALPTGLGKTLIAAVVMNNYFRWFPEGKIVFTAPSRPLVVQQIEACHNIVGIPQELTIDMTGQISPTKRADFWKTKRVFFVTPQVFEKDIQSGTCLVKYLVCLVIDEAHRALGNYSYCVAVRELMAIPVQLRLLALTATPGSKQQAIQHVINNLLISTLEYRNESDPDVSPYVHNRKIELIQVAMGEEAIQINNLLLNVIRIYAARLSAMGILLNRDYQTLSPSDLLNSRDKFRQAPPPELPSVKYGEVERFFGALITLYHVRKLLSSHGIRPAYEMLEEKLQKGSFAGLMSRNEDIQRAKLLMQQNLSRGTPNPKLSKMLEVLIDHFKSNDKQSSRVIIFSNFRGSVRDIMEALSKVGDTVKAAQFVGQSAGKSLRGQSQKVQQAVLEKFRSGGYNVIVATSIGEEVLACEGSEMKGYMRKQANSKAVKKHMRNGGIASFDFHSSPRMIPHIFKPEVQFVELSIEKFVPRGKKVKDDHAETLKYRDKLTPDEANLIAKYFNNSERGWKPSLIAFPHYQTFPSRVHQVMHSYRTGMLIDSMQHLQGHIFSRNKDEEEFSSFQQLGAERVGQQKDDGEGFLRSSKSPDANPERCTLRFQASPTRTVGTAEKHEQPELNNGNPPPHSCLFSSDFVTVDACGNVSILLVPSLHIMEISRTKQNSTTTEHLSCSKTHFDKSCPSNEKIKVQATLPKGPEQTLPLDMPPNTETGLQFQLHSSDWQQNGIVDTIERSMGIKLTDEILQNEIDSPRGTPDVMEVKAPLPQADDDMETALSPRLTDYFESGVVPESPVGGASCAKDISEFHERDNLGTPKRAKISTGILSTSRSPSSGKFEKVVSDSFDSGENISGSPANNTKDSSMNNVKDVNERCTPGTPASEKIPPETTGSGCCSKDWCFTPSNCSGSIKQQQKLKRLRRVGEGDSHLYTKCRKNSLPSVAEHLAGMESIQNKRSRGKKNCYKNGKAYIDEEAEVSSGADTSDEDEEDAENDDSYDDSFIDDRINPTAGSTQAATASVDMIAVYRRSLLSQSPIAWQANNTSTSSPDSLAVGTRMSGSGCSSVVHTKYRVSGSSEYAANVIPETGEASKVESRKRKLGVHEQGSLPVVNLEREFSIHTEFVKEENGGDCDLFSDDQFYESIDLDEVEAQATLLLKHKTQFSRHEQENVPRQDIQNSGCPNSPSFDLGI
ncbi:hypothetical protein CDL15_Pgr028325 [Punica granatum]|uniref:Helicase ATP-binding domain-containing protein n=1 Tax=Punica granatum TaxID=22663 RepID=A0A218W5V1_PUNGR|nr:hypothetical protein CDL15_Pgr028325 [Punica granatum]